MAVSTLEGIVENGRIRLRDDVRLPENTKVYVVIPGLGAGPKANIRSPRLVHPEQADDFAKQVIEVSADEGL
ncbi:MAG: hypothetical protein V3T83_16615 [Acidobacteriota bacterium]